ncbi:MAG: FAD-binding oxidoreductase [Candidatus Hydrogenedentes bacterium]|nr:FAD-binding oxidoreductase [Candidatus Hydrogenedentota bacterium]
MAGWGRLDPRPCQVYRPERRRARWEILSGAGAAGLIARGLGRSYGDTSVNEAGTVLAMTRLNRMIGFDPSSGVLECEAGVSLAEILDVFLPRGFFLPVTPGTKFVTVGGAIANDIHGKNHHRDGTFGQFVESMTLLLPSGEIMVCSPSDHADIFWATVGGIGLTGIILTARLRLHGVQSAYVRVDYHKSPDLDDALGTMAASDERYKYSVAWVDCLAGGKALGRSILMQGNHALPEHLPARLQAAPLAAPRARQKRIPLDFPSFVLNPLSIKAFNTLFYASHLRTQGVIVHYDKYFYPLDRILDWNRMYGKAGFVQYQATLPIDQRQGLVRVLERLSQSRRASFLAVLKCFGAGNPGLLSHPIRGYTLTLDIPNRPGLIPFLHELDAILLEHGGRLYLAKDAAAMPETIAAMYPRLPEFRALKERLDPEHKLTSSMARRLGIVPGGTGHGDA